ncbi:RHS repeat domain-containing protein [Pseudomonas sp. Pseusp122]|uniref:RHS repeat domain-containing protein n=1 Tax=unclassified Pseudomonas TaxID=196821 RepID=UPI0039A486AD
MNTTSAALHRHTPVLLAVDPRGLPINSIAFCREHASDEPEERVNRSEFDAAGRLIARWDPRLWGDNAPANLTTIYSLGGQALSSDSVDAGWRLSLSGEGGQVVDAWDGRGTIKQVEYDELLRPTAVFEDGEQIERLMYGGADLTEFNQVGQLIQHDDLAGTRLNNRFALTGEVIEQTQEFADDLDTTRWRFNALGEALEQTDALGNIQRFAHTVAGQLKGTYVQLKNRPEQQLVGDIRYDAQGRVEFETAGNGVISTALYRPEDGRLRELKASRNNVELLQHLIYDYDPAGNVTRIEDHAQPTRHFANQRIDPVSTYQYDTLYQLIEATGREAVNQGLELVNYTQTYRYDSGGNMQRLTHVGGQDHSQTFATSRTSNRTLPVVNDHVPDEEEIAAAFDANGNLRELQAGQALTWDRRNQLQQVRPVIRESGIDDSERYIYNASGQRTRKIQTTLAKVVTHSAEVRYLPGLEIRTDTATGEVLHVVTAQAGRSNVRVLHWQSPPPGGIGNDQVRYSLNDHLGSSLLELDNDAQIISQEGYYPFGGTAWWATRNAVEASYKTVRYSGKERDATGLYYYGLRYYAPWLLRWINPDPAGAVDGLNMFCFVGNAPVASVDRGGAAGDKVLDRIKEQIGQRYKTSKLVHGLSSFSPDEREMTKAVINTGLTIMASASAALAGDTSPETIQTLVDTFGHDAFSSPRQISEIVAELSKRFSVTTKFMEGLLHSDSDLRLHIVDFQPGVHEGVLAFGLKTIEPPKNVFHSVMNSLKGSDNFLSSIVFGRKGLMENDTLYNSFVLIHEATHLAGQIDSRDFWYLTENQLTAGVGGHKFDEFVSGITREAIRIVQSGPDTTRMSDVTESYYLKQVVEISATDVDEGFLSLVSNRIFRDSPELRTKIGLQNADSLASIALRLFLGR